MRRLAAGLIATLVLAGCGTTSGASPAPPAPVQTSAADPHADWKTHVRSDFVVRVPPSWIDDTTTVRSLASTQEVPAALIELFRAELQQTPILDQLAMADTDLSYGKAVPTLLTITVLDHRRRITPGALEQYDLQRYRNPAYHGVLARLAHLRVKLRAGTAIEWRQVARWRGNLRYAAVQYSFAHGKREYAITVFAPANRMSWARGEARAIAATLRLRQEGP